MTSDFFTRSPIVSLPVIFRNFFIVSTERQYLAINRPASTQYKFDNLTGVFFQLLLTNVTIGVPVGFKSKPSSSISNSLAFASVCNSFRHNSDTNEYFPQIQRCTSCTKIETIIFTLQFLLNLFLRYI